MFMSSNANAQLLAQQSDKRGMDCTTTEEVNVNVWQTGESTAADG